MRKTYLLLLAAVAAITVFTGCKKENAKTEEPPSISNEELAMAEVKLPEPVAEVETSGFTLDDFKANKDGVKAEAHKKYLTDALSLKHSLQEKSRLQLRALHTAIRKSFISAT